MSTIRAHNRMSQGMPQVPRARFVGRRDMFLVIDEPFGWENKENFPVITSSSLQQNDSVPRQLPRLPLQDVSHLFPSNGCSRNKEMQSVRAIGRGRRRLLDSPFSPVTSKKRRTSEVMSLIWERLPRASVKYKQLFTSSVVGVTIGMDAAMWDSKLLFNTAPLSGS
ncbi:hypothetical protein R1flu_022203 [Riccia fluitans]|uniref:Uncharacterized protein n=1 Tax=Riccia fluitans TaxID=41844 RepID=A0ABD1ZRI8_9MARC